MTTEGEDKADRVATHVEERLVISRFCLCDLQPNEVAARWRRGRWFGGLAAYSRERKRG